MGLKAGIIGLPNVGKSTIFNALTKSTIPAENYPFCTIDPNSGIVKVPDKRIYEIAKIFNPKVISPTTIEFVDIAGLVRGASKGEGLGNQFLSHIRDVNAIIHVVRSFIEENITHVDGQIDPIRDIEVIETELLIRDIDSVEKRIEKLQKNARSGDKKSVYELETLNFIYKQMNSGILVYDIKLDNNQKKSLLPLSLLTNKPILYVINIDENQLTKNSKDMEDLFTFINKKNKKYIKLCGKLESEIATLNEEDKEMYLQEYNISEPALNFLIQVTYKLLNLETFFTAGEKEVKAWTVIKGSKAPDAANEIHTDIKRGFIKAEIYSFKDLIQYKSEPNLKNEGKIRQEGKEYIVKDGDIIFFKFNI